MTEIERIIGHDYSCGMFRLRGSKDCQCSCGRDGKIEAIEQYVIKATTKSYRDGMTDGINETKRAWKLAELKKGLK